MNIQEGRLNPAQVEILNMMSFVKSEDSFAQLKEVIANYFAKQLEDEVSRLWTEGELSDERIEQFRDLHERTSYR